MNKKRKIILTSIAATLAISTIPAVAVACSDDKEAVSNNKTPDSEKDKDKDKDKEQGIKTKATSNLSIKGFPINAEDLKVNIKSIQNISVNGLPNQNGQSSLKDLSNYIEIVKVSDNQSIPDSTILSSINFTNGTTVTPVTISFNLGVLGSFALTATQNGTISNKTTFNSIFTKAKFSNISDLSQYLSGLDTLNLGDASVSLNLTNTSDSYNPNGIQQYIYLNKNNQTAGAIVGSYSTSSSSWSWLYSQNTLNQISTNSKTTLGQSGIPVSVNNLEDLSNYLNFLPTLNQYSISKKATVVVAIAKDNKQNITITWANNSVSIEGSYSSSWVYSFNYNNHLLKTKIQAYIDAFNALTLTTQNTATILPSSLNEQNISNYITNIPNIPDGTQINYIFSPNNKDGNLKLKINLSSIDKAAEISSTEKTITGFNTDQKVVDSYIVTFDALSLTTSSDIATILPSIVNADNISNYITNIPAAPQGTQISYTLAPDNAKGTLDLTLIISSLDKAVTKTATKKTVSGFNTDQKVVETYINSFNSLTLVTNDDIATILPSIVNAENINQYITNIPAAPEGTKITYTLTPDDTKGTLNLTLTLSSIDGSVTTKATEKTITGFNSKDKIKIEEYITTFNKLDLTTQNLENVLPSSINKDNISQYITNIPQTPEGTKISYTFSPNDTTGTLGLSITITLNDDSITKTSEVKTITGFITDQKLVDDYITKFNALTLVTKGINTILPSTVKAENISQYITNIPVTPNGATISYSFSPNNTAGTLDLTLTISIISDKTVTKTSTKKTITGFKTFDKNTLDEYIKKFNDLTLTTKEIAKILPSTITKENISDYITNIPAAPEGTSISYVFKADDSEGTLDITLSLTSHAVDNVSIQIANKKTITGFLTDQKLVNDYITAFDALSLTTSNDIATILPSTISAENINQYINDIPEAPWGSKLTYALTADNQKGTLDLTLTITTDDGVATKTSTKKTISGFNSEEKTITTYIDSFNNLNLTTSNDIATILPSTITTENISKYITNIPQIPTDTKITYALTADNQTGSLKFTITVALTNDKFSKTSSEKTVTGFNTDQKILDAYIKTFDDLTLTTSENINTIAPSSVTSDNISQYITNIPVIPTGTKITYTLTPDDKTGTLKLKVRLTSSDDKVKKDSTEKTISGFKSTEKEAVDKYITTFNATTLTTQNIDNVLPSAITSDNIKDHITNIPQEPADTQITYSLDSDSEKGELDLSLTISSTDKLFTATSEPKKITGFATDQKLADAYITAFNKLTLTTKNLNTILPSIITSENISNYITDIPAAPTGTKITYTFKPDNQKGELALTLTITSVDNVVTTDANEKTISGFNTDDKIVQAHIDAFKALTLTTKDLNTILPATITDKNISQYITNIPTSFNDAKIVYNLVPDNKAGTLSLTLTISSLDNLVSKTSEAKSITGFNKIQEVVTKYMDEIKKLQLSAKPEYKDTLPSQLPNIKGNFIYQNFINGSIPAIPANSNIAYHFLASDTKGAIHLSVIYSPEGELQQVTDVMIYGFKKS